MRALARAVVLTCAVAVAVPAWGLPASAETGSETASSGAYFWRGTPRRPDQLPANPPPVQGNADGVEPGKLAVAAEANQDDKVSFLFFSLSTLPAGATITRATLTVPLASGTANTSYGEDPAKVWACPAGPEGFGGEDAGALEDAPARLCDTANSPGKASPDGAAYVFDVTPIAAGWTTANDGLALAPAPDARTAPFQVVFDSADKAVLAYEFTPPAADAGAAPTSGTDTAAGSSSSPALPADPVGGSTLGGAATTALPPTDLGTAAAPAVAPVDAPVAAAAAPAGTVPAPAVAGARRAAAVGPAGVLRPTPQFWLAALGLGAALVVLSLALGAAPAASPAASAPTLLSRALAARARSSALSRPLSPATRPET